MRNVSRGVRPRNAAQMTVKITDIANSGAAQGLRMTRPIVATAPLATLTYGIHHQRFPRLACQYSESVSARLTSVAIPARNKSVVRITRPVPIQNQAGVSVDCVVVVMTRR